MSLAVCLGHGMTLVLLVTAIAIAVGLVRRGSLDELARTQFQWVPVLLVALVVQVVVDIWDPDWLGETGDVAVLVGSNIAVAVFLIRNWKLPGMPAAGAGMVLNVTVISANGAMPVSRRAEEVAGMLADPGVKHEVLGSNTLLPWLADVIPIPVLHRLISPGDILIAFGIGWLVYRRMIEGQKEGLGRQLPIDGVE